MAADRTGNLNPQAAQMADESMVRNLSTLRHARFGRRRRRSLPVTGSPSERAFSMPVRGTGEISSRLAVMFPGAQVLGVDIVDAHLELARLRYSDLAPRLRFEHQSIYELRGPDGRFDLTVCRHVLHAIPHAEAVVKELARVTRSGGDLHLISEDYRMLHFQSRDGCDPSDFWHAGPLQFGAATGNRSLHRALNVFSILTRLDLRDIAMEYVILDTLRTPRETFASIIEAWRDGYVDAIAEHTSYSREEVLEYFDAMAAVIRDPLGYACWLLPVASARVP